MKKIICLLSFALSIAYASAQTTISLAPSWNATVKVIDENDQSVANARVEMSYYVKPPPGENESSGTTYGFTDTNGLVSLMHANTGSIGLGFEATKDGFYETRIGHEFIQFKGNDPEKWSPHIVLALKKIGRPIPMYAKQIDSIKFPLLNKAIGYDLMVGDWVAPYGKGARSDFLFTEVHTNAQSGYAFTINFSHPEDGIQGLTRDWNHGVSGLLSAHEAPVDGYISQYVQTGMPNPDRIYYFRVRTALDNQGHILSTLYGKIYGDFMQFSYYLNPTPNDRNIEFDMRNNLLGGLKSFQEVKHP